MRSGSTSLFRYLADHPQVFMAPGKELRYFDRRFDRGIDWYRAAFADAPADAVVGEASPDYLHAPGAVERMAAAVPGVRAVAVLRHPVQRAYSHFHMEVARDREHRSWEEVVAAELAGDASTVYLGRSRYGELLARLHAAVGAERSHVLAFEDLRDDPGPTFAAVCRFLGVAEVTPPSLGRQVNGHFRVRSPRLRVVGRRLPGPLRTAVARINQVEQGYPPMAPATEARLRAALADDAARAVALAGWSHDPWGLVPG